MKITIYDLLGLVKDGKAPKEIKIGNIKLKYNEGCEDYYIYYGKGLFEYKFGNCKNFLNDEVEIIEEPKKIEKIKQLNNVANCKELTELEDKQQINNHILKDKINKLIDEINKLKENEHEI